jgi:hypothetical protein
MAKTKVATCNFIVVGIWKEKMKMERIANVNSRCCRDEMMMSALSRPGMRDGCKDKM